MVNHDTLVRPDVAVEGSTVLLSKIISAVHLERNENGAGAKLGSLSQLGPGTEIVICGEGFNDRTVKVRAPDGYYFVFSQDLGAFEELRSTADAPSARKPDPVRFHDSAC